MTLLKQFAIQAYNSRRKLGYSQETVAEAISVSVRWYQKIEAGERLPGTITAIRIILFLHLNVEEFREEVALIVPLRAF